MLLGRKNSDFQVRWTVLIFMVLLTMFSSMFSYTYSYFHDTAVNTGNRFTATDISKYLRVSPGKARATFSAAGDPSGETRPVACYTGDDWLELNFGEVVEGNRRNFEDVVRLDNITGQTLAVTWFMEGDMAAVAGEGEHKINLSPAAGNSGRGTAVGSVYQNPYSLDIKLDVNAPAGIYKGYLIIRVNGDFLQLKIPARVLVTDRGQSRPAVSVEACPAPGSMSGAGGSDDNAGNPNTQADTGRDTSGNPPSGGESTEFNGESSASAPGPESDTGAGGAGAPVDSTGNGAAGGGSSRDGGANEVSSGANSNSSEGN